MDKTKGGPLENGVKILKLSVPDLRAPFDAALLDEQINVAVGLDYK